MFGAMTPAPAPCRTRAATRTLGSGAIAHSADASTKTASPMLNKRRRP